MRRREFLALAPLGIYALGRQPTKARLIAALEQQIPDWIGKARVPGLSLALIQNAKVIWRRGFGLTEASAKMLVDERTMFEAASMSKPVFAYVVMKLCESGVMNLDVPLTQYTTERFLEGDPRLDLITARHVLSHTTGFQNWRSEREPLAIHFTPGSKYMYSGEGYNYLQTIVTKLLGQSFETFMTKRLFAPFGMTASRYVWNDEAAKRMASPHDAQGKPLQPNKSTESSVARYGSAGALLTTPGDYAKFLIEVIHPKPADTIRLKPATVRDMLRPQVKVENSEPASSWALGWEIFHNPARDFIYHGGDNKGFHCACVASVAGQSGYVAMTNGENGPEVLRTLITFGLMQEFLLA